MKEDRQPKHMSNPLGNIGLSTKRNLIELFKPTFVQRAVSSQILLWENL